MFTEAESSNNVKSIVVGVPDSKKNAGYTFSRESIALLCCRLALCHGRDRQRTSIHNTLFSGRVQMLCGSGSMFRLPRRKYRKAMRLKSFGANAPRISMMLNTTPSRESVPLLRCRLTFCPGRKRGRIYIYSVLMICIFLSSLDLMILINHMPSSVFLRPHRKSASLEPRSVASCLAMMTLEPVLNAYLTLEMVPVA